ncbi:MAG: exopolysaccharide biosynthesis polyprenyl glycosylphosphotransferase [Opitutae bacterium]|nr:exopolysaccharide biosynthesis polyprenyl glycosylphosphotransferase [Opitutae bacterium]
MLDRRSAGLASIHSFLVAAEAAGLWLVMAEGAPLVRGKQFTTLLPHASYPLAIASAVLLTMGSAWAVKSELAVLGWGRSLQLAAKQLVIIAGTVFTVVVGFKDPGISRLFLASYFPILGLLLVLVNRFQPVLLRQSLFGGRSRMPTLVMGDGRQFPDMRRWLEAGAPLGLQPIGRVRYAGELPNLPELPEVGQFEDLRATILATGAQQVLMLNLPKHAEDFDHLVRACAATGCRLLVQNDLAFRLAHPLRQFVQDGYSFMAFQDEPLENPVLRGVKRGMDIAISLPVVLFILPPLGLMVWLMQRRQAPGPLFYRQPRSGRAGREFMVLKFRTMYATAEGQGQTSPGDIRVFRFGRFLRRTSLDEMPQFWNALRGDMSVVGPRPHYVRHDSEFADAVEVYRMRFFVKPGITGLAQSHGLRGEMRTPDAISARLQLDLFYIHNWSVWLDCVIIWRTIRQILRPPSGAC